MELPSDLKEFLSSLNGRRVRYLVVGAHALAVHGVPRYTGDLDIWVARDPKNAERVVAALKDFGFGGMRSLSVDDFKNPNMVIALGNPPLRIDVLTSISGCTFAAAWKRRKPATIDGVRTSVLSRADLEKNKLAAGRTKDLLDLELLANVPRPHRRSKA